MGVVSGGAGVANRNRPDRPRGSLYLNVDLRRPTNEGILRKYGFQFVVPESSDVKPHRTGFPKRTRKAERMKILFWKERLRSPWTPSSAGVCLLAGSRVPSREIRQSCHAGPDRLGRVTHNGQEQRPFKPRFSSATVPRSMAWSPQKGPA